MRLPVRAWGRPRVLKVVRVFDSSDGDVDRESVRVFQCKPGDILGPERAVPILGSPMQGRSPGSRRYSTFWHSG